MLLSYAYCSLFDVENVWCPSFVWNCRIQLLVQIIDKLCTVKKRQKASRVGSKSVKNLNCIQNRVIEIERTTYLGCKFCICLCITNTSEMEMVLKDTWFFASQGMNYEPDSTSCTFSEDISRVRVLYTRFKDSRKALNLTTSPKLRDTVQEVVEHREFGPRIQWKK